MKRPITISFAILLLWASLVGAEEEKRFSLPTILEEEIDTWPIAQPTNQPAVVDAFCELCQLLYHNIRREAEHKKGSGFGGYDWALEEALDPLEACSEVKWNEWARKSYQYTMEDLQPRCEDFLREFDSDVEEILSAYRNKEPEDGCRKLCWQTTHACNSKDEIWTPEQFPHNRPSLAERNLEISERFMEANQKRKGVVIPELARWQYQVMAEGDGKTHPEASDTLYGAYNATFFNGKPLDVDNNSAGVPIEFEESDTFPCLQEGLKLMSENSDYIFYCAPDTAYGEAGVQGTIGPNEGLIFRLHLLEIRRAPSMTTDEPNEAMEEINDFLMNPEKRPPDFDPMNPFPRGSSVPIQTDDYDIVLDPTESKEIEDLLHMEEDFSATSEDKNLNEGKDEL